MLAGKGWYETGTDVLVDSRYRYGTGLQGLVLESKDCFCPTLKAEITGSNPVCATTFSNTDKPPGHAELCSGGFVLWTLSARVRRL